MGVITLLGLGLRCHKASAFNINIHYSSILIRHNSSGSNGRNELMKLYTASKRQRRKRLDEEIETGLNWETFEFGINPKRDGRFSNSKQNDLHNLDFDEEKEEDRLAARKFDEMNAAFHDLLPEMVAAAASVIEPFINEVRIERIDSVLSQRTKRSRFLFENPGNPSNVFACLRTIDSFGIQVSALCWTGLYCENILFAFK